jgi:hypothetical protein
MENQRVIELLEKIASNTESKDSFYILVNDRNTIIRTKFNPLIQLNKTKKWEIALVNLETYYSFPNIDSTNNNFRYSPDNGTTWGNIDLPTGSHEIDDINNYIQRIMKENGHYNSADNTYYVSVEPNNNTLKCVVNIESSTYKVDFTSANSIRTVLGFNSQIYSNGYHESENIVNILNISSLRVTCDIIGSSYINGGTDNIIYSFFPKVGPGFKVIEEPLHMIYLPVTLNTISSLEVKLIDQNGKLIDLRGEDLAIRFHIRQA